METRQHRALWIFYRTGFKVSFYQVILFEAKHKMEIHTLLSTVSSSGIVLNKFVFLGDI